MLRYNLMFGFSCFHSKVPLYGPCSILSSHSSLSNAMRKKKSSCPSAHLRSVQCFLLFMFTSPSSLPQLSSGFINMDAKISLTFPSTIVPQYWPGVVSGTSFHPLLYQKNWMLKSFVENERSNGSMFG